MCGVLYNWWETIITITKLISGFTLSIVYCVVATGRRSAGTDLLRGNTHLEIRYLSSMNNEETGDSTVSVWEVPSLYEVTHRI